MHTELDYLVVVSSFDCISSRSDIVNEKQAGIISQLPLQPLGLGQESQYRFREVLQEAEGYSRVMACHLLHCLVCCGSYELLIKLLRLLKFMAAMFRYRTVMCKDYPRCNRDVCFFAHTQDEIRRVDQAWSWNQLVTQLTPPLFTGYVLNLTSKILRFFSIQNLMMRFKRWLIQV